MRISVEGNIAAGKSTLFSSIAERPYFRDNVSMFPEPLHEWGEILHLYCKDRKSWSLPLTLDILRGFHKGYTTPHAIFERNPYACRYVFTEMLKNDSILSQSDMVLIEQYMHTFGWKPDAVIYLDVAPSTCLDRVETRGRPGEIVTYDELKMISYMYDKMFRDQFRHVPVYRVSPRPEEDIEAFHNRVGSLIERILMKAT